MTEHEIRRPNVTQNPNIKRTHILYALLIIVAIFLAYGDSFNNGFIWDDQAFIVNNPAIRHLSLNSILSNFTERGNTSSSALLSKDVWRPLVGASFALDYRLWKLEPRYYHIENTVMHAVNALMVYVLAMLVFGNATIALIAALIFGIHPVQTEAVTWISGRSNVLFLLFYLAALIFHIIHRKRSERTSTFYNLCLISFLASLFSKEMAVTLPVIMLAYDMHFKPRESARSYAVYYLPLCLVVICYLITRFSVLGVLAQRSIWWGGALASNFLTMLEAVTGYIRLLILPVNLRVEYVIEPARSLFESYTLVAVIVLSVVFSLYMFTRDNRRIAFCIIWFFIALIPVYNIVPCNTIMAERFLYAPIIGFAILCGMAVSALLYTLRDNLYGRYALKIAVGLLLVWYLFGTLSRNVEWRSELIFCTNEVKRSPDNPRFHFNLGMAYVVEAEKNTASPIVERSYYLLATSEFEKAMVLRPDFSGSYRNAAIVYGKLGLYDKAKEHYRRALLLELKRE